MKSRGSFVAAAVTLLVGVLTSCGASSGRFDASDGLDALAPVAGPPTTAEEVVVPDPACQEHGVTASLRPSATPAADSTGFVAELRRRGRMRVGVDENTVGFSSWNADTGAIEGFEVDLAHEIAMRVFGEAYTPDVVEPVPVNTDEKVPFVRDDRVDLTISAISMSCKRWAQVAFSTEYYTAHQQFLVRAGSTIDDIGDLAGKTVCVTESSSSIGILEEHVPAAVLLPVRGRTDCLVALQEGIVDAYFGHDSFLYGMLGQDTTVAIKFDLLDPEDTVSHYGIAIAKEHPDFVRFVNGVLDELRTNGRWAELHDTWLESPPLDIPDAQPPTPVYRD